MRDHGIEMEQQVERSGSGALRGGDRERLSASSVDGMGSFGASAPAELLYERFGITAEAIFAPSSGEYQQGEDQHGYSPGCSNVARRVDRRTIRPVGDHDGISRGSVSLAWAYTVPGCPYAR